MKTLKILAKGKLSFIFRILFCIFTEFQYRFFIVKWYLKGYRKPNKDEINLVVKNITFIFKSFERQKQAKKLYKNIQSYYPGAKVIIADDSSKPLHIKGENLEIIQLPFNSGLSYGLNRALEKVTSPFVVRMDDDELLTPLSQIGNELQFLKRHPGIDLVGFGILSTPKCIPTNKSSVIYYRQPMSYAPKKLKIPHLTKIDNSHIVVGKSPNVFLIRTEKLKEIGWDDNIRMIDHDEFFRRAAGNIVSVLNPNTIIFHNHNIFNKNYQKYRSDVQGDRIYIMKKYSKKFETKYKVEY